MDNEKISKPLFDNDVRHSIESVEFRWAREQQRRRRLMLKLSPILILVIVGLPRFICLSRKYSRLPIHLNGWMALGTSPMIASMASANAIISRASIQRSVVTTSVT